MQLVEELIAKSYLAALGKWKFSPCQICHHRRLIFISLTFTFMLLYSQIQSKVENVICCCCFNFRWCFLFWVSLLFPHLGIFLTWWTQGCETGCGMVIRQVSIWHSECLQWTANFSNYPVPVNTIPMRPEWGGEGAQVFHCSRLLVCFAGTIFHCSVL